MGMRRGSYGGDDRYTFFWVFFEVVKMFLIVTMDDQLCE